MATCFSWWKYITVLCFTVHSVKTVPQTHSSKACYGVMGLTCTRHYLSCRDTQIIAITDAYYTANTECSTSGLSSCSVIPEGVNDDGYFRFITTELSPIYSRCSMQTECVYPAPRRSAGRTFSVVKYQCIERNELIRINGGMAKDISQVSVISGDNWPPSNSSFSKAPRYTCWLQPNETNVDITVYTLDARLRRGIQPECLSQPTVQTGNIITTTTCNNLFQPFEKLNILHNLPRTITVLDEPTQKTLLWLWMNATSLFSVKCQHDQVQTNGNSGVPTMASYNISPQWTTEEMLHTTEVPDGTKHNIGAIVGGVAVTILAASVTTFFVARLIRKRGRNMQETVKETYFLSNVKADNTYCLAMDIPQGVKLDAGEMKTQSNSSDYEYATADGMASEPDTYATCDPPVPIAESDYNLIADNPSTLTTDYDTTSSDRQYIHTGGHIREDEHGYNLFQKTNMKTLQNDYDTVASATKAVAQLSENDKNTGEDNYDHFSRATVALETLGSPYDTAKNT